MFDFRLATVFRLGCRLSKHKMTKYFENLGGDGPLSPPGYIYDSTSILFLHFLTDV